MALPPEISTTLVSGTFVTDAGRPIVGTVELTPSVGLLNSAETSTLLRLERYVIQLDETGSFSALLASTDKTNINPKTWHWSARVADVADFVWAEFRFTVPGNQITINVADYAVLPADVK